MIATFGDDVQFLKKYVDTIVLGDPDRGQIAVVPEYQGRIMTSTTRGMPGASHGWINRERIAGSDLDRQINLYGGEDRFWLCPEGGQYSVFFDPGTDMEFSNWRTPPIIDTEPFEVLNTNSDSVEFRRTASVTNYARFEFEIQIDREVILLDDSDISDGLATSIAGLSYVGFESNNRVENIGRRPWLPESGLLGIWILGLNHPSPSATVIIPFRKGSVDQLGSIVNAGYFGTLDERRLVVNESSSLIYFLGDGQLRSKLGVTFPRARATLGSWDSASSLLTLVQFTLPNEAEHGYINNVWEIQDEPFSGDVVNSYNDGPNESGGMLGPFYELESLSPALALDPGEAYTHVHRTIHLQGDRSDLDRVANQVFGVCLNDIENVFGS